MLRGRHVGEPAPPETARRRCGEQRAALFDELGRHDGTGTLEADISGRIIAELRELTRAPWTRRRATTGRGTSLAGVQGMSGDMDLVLFALGASKRLGEHIANLLDTALQPHEERDFEDGEHKSRPLVSVRGRDVFVVSSLHGDATSSVNDRLCRLLFFIGALRDAAAGRITAIVPYLCYARKDRKTKARDPVTTRYVAGLFESVGLDRIVTVDVHNVAAYQNAFRIRTEHVDARPLFVEHVRTLAAAERICVVSPDPGGFHRAEDLRDSLARDGATVELAVLGKHRSEGVVRTGAFVGHVEGRVAIIIDDLIATGTTLVRAAEACRQRGAIAIHAMATHGVFASAAAATLSAPTIDTITVTNTVARGRFDPGLPASRLTVLDVAPRLARVIAALHQGGSLVELQDA
jgi:ribose-phosphate pyrophosphokinase